MAKKSARILVGLVCKKTGSQNYVTSINKMNVSKLNLNRYCKVCGEHVEHEMRKKLD